MPKNTWWIASLLTLIVLLGVSGLSASPKDLLDVEAKHARAGAALDLYVRRIVREIGALTAVLGGLDMLAFTAGVGEHSSVLRERICGALAWLGVLASVLLVLLLLRWVTRRSGGGRSMESRDSSSSRGLRGSLSEKASVSLSSGVPSNSFSSHPVIG